MPSINRLDELARRLMRVNADDGETADDRFVASLRGRLRAGLAVPETSLGEWCARVVPAAAVVTALVTGLAIAQGVGGGASADALLWAALGSSTTEDVLADALLRSMLLATASPNPDGQP